MSDVSQGPDWWLGADGKWYPPVAVGSPNPAAPAGAVPPGHVGPGQAPPGQVPLGQAPPGQPPPGQAPPGYGQPGYGQPVIIQQEKSKATPILLGCLLALLVVPVIAVLCIAAVTLLGKSASSKFTSVAKAVSVIEAPAADATTPPVRHVVITR